ncbi:MAG: hypothetical protein ACOCSO_02935, partial [Thermoplasmatota archaeon]
MEEFPHDRQGALVNLAFLVALAIVMPVAFMGLMGTDLMVFAALIMMVSALILVLGISPLLTAHSLSGNELILRQGWYFRARIPLDNISSVRRLESGPRRTGVFFRVLRASMFVTTRRHDLLELELKEPQRFPWALNKRAGRVIFDTSDNRAFLRSLEGKGITPS